MLTITASVSWEIQQNLRILFVSFPVKVTCEGVFLLKLQAVFYQLQFLLQVFFLNFDKKCRPITFRWLILFILKLPHLITLLPRLHQSNEIHFVASWWALIIKGRCNTLCSNDISLNVTLISTACHCIVRR